MDRVGFGPKIFGQYHRGLNCCHLTRYCRFVYWFHHFLFCLMRMMGYWTSFSSIFVWLRLYIFETPNITINKIICTMTLLLLVSLTLRVSDYLFELELTFFLVFYCCFIFHSPSQILNIKFYSLFIWTTSHCRMFSSLFCNSTALLLFT